MIGPRYTSLATSLPSTVPFVGPETQERSRGRAFAARLGANENVFGPSPSALQAIVEAASGAWMYGDPEMHDLRSAIASHHSVSALNVTVGEGIDGLLGNIVRLVVGAGDTVVTSDGAYPTFNFHVAGFGGTIHKVPYLGNHEDPDTVLAEARRVDAKLIYLANPDNPMGTHHPAAVIENMVRALPETTLLVLDEAYIDLAPPGTAPGIPIDTPNVVRMRTFSKGYGLAGMRVGYALGAVPLISAFDKVRNHFGVGRVAQAAALAALADQAWLEEIRRQVALSREVIAQIARRNGLLPLPSATNFVTVDCGRDGVFARRVLQALLSHDIFVRMPGVPPHDRCIRISAGRSSDLDRLAHALPLALDEASSA